MPTQNVLSHMWNIKKHSRIIKKIPKDNRIEEYENLSSVGSLLGTGRGRT